MTLDMDAMECKSVKDEVKVVISVTLSSIVL